MADFYSIDTFAPRVSLGYLLRRVNKLSIVRVEAAFDGNDITFTQWIVLALVSFEIATTCTELSRNMDHDKGALTRVIDQLEERGLVERRRDAGDRRVSQLTATTEGRKIVADLARRVVNVWNDILEGFDREEIERLIGTLGKLLARLDPSDPQAEQ
ncbi:MAG: MarR family winged helix-turn-helix transcriptional regulator [Sphingomonas sp.]|jgi:DNA-binding MarR family transcriptional regulator